MKERGKREGKERGGRGKREGRERRKRGEREGEGEGKERGERVKREGKERGKRGERERESSSPLPPPSRLIHSTSFLINNPILSQFFSMLIKQ